MNFVNSLLWDLAVTAIKISILHLYVTIFHMAWFRRMAYAIMVVCMIYSVVFAVDLFLVCRSFALNGDGSTETLNHTVTGVINLLLDLLILSMPMPPLWGLQIPFRKKLALCSIFGFGFGSVVHLLFTSLYDGNQMLTVPSLRICILCCVRLKYMLAISQADVTYTIADFGLWLAIEPLLGVTSASLPLLGPVFAKFPKASVMSMAQRSAEGNADHEAGHQRWPMSTFRRDRSEAQRLERFEENPELHPMGDDGNTQFPTAALCSMGSVAPSNGTGVGQIRIPTHRAVDSGPRVV